MKDNLQIIFYAPFGKNTPANKIGGAEAGCLKTLQIYKDNGIEVHCIDKPARNKGLGRYIADMALATSKLCAMMIKHPRALVHIVGFYDRIIDIELFLMRLTKLFGRKSIYEVRNGGMVNVYFSRDESYRKKQQQIFRMATGVLCQGETYVEFLRKHLNIESFYYPNYILDDYIKPLQDRPKNEINLIFFGRLVPEKNIDVIVKTAALVWRKHPKTKLHLYGGISEEYETEITSLAKSLGLPEGTVLLHHRQNFETIHKQLLKSHFFIFPSTEPCEGHSNSLTEAMGCGVVPIASTAGFNASICGDDFLIMKSINPEEYAIAINEILENNSWTHYSTKAYQRTLENFTARIVGNRLVKYLKSL